MAVEASGELDAENEAVTYAVEDDDAAAVVQLAGTFTATVDFEGTVDGTNWVAIEAENRNDATQATSAMAAGLYLVPVAGLSDVRARVSAYTSGTVEASVGVGRGAPSWS